MLASSRSLSNNIYFSVATKIQNTIKWTEALDEVFKRNWHEEDGNIKSQSFGSSDGVYRLYPGI